MPCEPADGSVPPPGEGVRRKDSLSQLLAPVLEPVVPALVETQRARRRPAHPPS